MGVESGDSLRPDLDEVSRPVVALDHALEGLEPAVGRSLSRLQILTEAVATPVANLFARAVFGASPEELSSIPLEAVPMPSLTSLRSDYVLLRSYARDIQRISEDIAVRLESGRWVGTTEYSSVDLARASALVGQALRAARIDVANLVQNQNDALYLTRQLMAGGGLVASATTTPVQREMYASLLQEAANLVVQLLAGFQQLPNTVSIDLLRREGALLARVREILDRLPRLSARGGTREDGLVDQFRRDLSRRLDKVELFGTGLPQELTTYSLSVAYLSLQAARVGPTDDGDALPGGSTRVDELLAVYPRLLIRGEAGGGKTTLLQWLAIQTAKRDFNLPGLRDLNTLVPFFVPLRANARKEALGLQSLVGLASTTLRHELTDTWISSCLQDGRALLLIDGVDEVLREDRGAVRDWLLDLLEHSSSKTRVVVTSRPAAASKDWLELPGFRIVDLLPMSNTDIERFVQYWHDAHDTGWDRDREGVGTGTEALKSQLLAEFRSRDNLRTLARTPLLCAMICAMNADGRGSLPVGFMALYRTALDMLLERRDRARHLSNTIRLPFSRDEIQLLLQELAWWLTLNGKSYATTGEAAEVLSRRIPGLRPDVQAPSQDVLEFLLERSGVLRSPSEDAVDFVHKTFQEFLAAAESVEQDNIGLLASKATDDQWHRVIAMAAGHAKSKRRKALLRNLLSTAKGSARTSNVLVAASCMEWAPEVEEDVRNAIASAVASVVPPKDLASANLLASSGDLGISALLHAVTTGIDADSARLCIRVALQVSTPLALQLMASLVKAFPDEFVASDVAAGWSNFESADFAQMVMAQLRSVDSAVLIENVESAQAAERFDSVLSYRLKVLRSSDLAEFAGLGKAMAIEIHALPNEIDLRKLGHWKLTRPSSIMVANAPLLRSVEGLEFLDNLDTVVIEDAPNLTTLEFVGGTSIRRLSVIRCGLDSLAGIESLRSLVELDLSGCADLSVVDELADLPMLTRVSIRGTDVYDLTVFSDRGDHFRQLDITDTPAASNEDAEILSYNISVRGIEPWSARGADGLWLE